MTNPSNVESSVVPATLSNINYEEPSDADVVQVCRDRLRSNGAWNGQGLLQHLAGTSRKDPIRAEYEPLRDLCEKIVYADEDGEPMPELTDEEKEKINELLEYSRVFHNNLTSGE